MARPVSLHVITVSDGRTRVSYYWDRLRSLEARDSVSVPKTVVLDLETVDSAEVERGAESDGYGTALDYRWNTDAILAFMIDHGFDRAFVRTERKAATTRLRDGSFVHRRDREVIDRTIESLLTQNEANGWPHGGGLVVREWLDLDWCPHPTHGCHPSVRYFANDGEVIGQTPPREALENSDRDDGNETADEYEFTCADGYEYLESVRERLSFDVPRRYAERIAAELEEGTWAIDLVATTAGDWYCLECNFNGVYWNRQRGAWWNMCGQGAFEPFSPADDPLGRAMGRSSRRRTRTGRAVVVTTRERWSIQNHPLVTTETMYTLLTLERPVPAVLATASRAGVH